MFSNDRYTGSSYRDARCRVARCDMFGTLDFYRSKTLFNQPVIIDVLMALRP